MARTLRPGGMDEDRLERSRRIGWIDLDSISCKRVLVVGAGALGNEVMKNLVLSGFQEIALVDMDRVVRSNLNRCMFFSEDDAERRAFKADVLASRASLLNPKACIQAINSRVEDVDPLIFQRCDLVLGCLDNIAARLHVNAHCCHHHVPLVDGGTQGTSGKVQVVLPPQGPCLQCAMNRSHYRVLEQRHSCSGSDTVFFEPKLGAEITTTSVIAAIQVREALKVLSGRRESCIRDVMHYNGLSNQVMELEVQCDPECQMHG